MRLFPPNSILEDEIFIPRNLDSDCDTIGNLLERFGEKFILSSLEDGEYSIAVDYYLQLLGTLTERFIADEHWCWFDDFYSPDYTVSCIWDKFIPYIRSSAIAGEPLIELESGLKLIEQTEAYQNYGYPSMIPKEVIRELIGNAVVHRDYSMKGAPVYFEINDQSIIIKSPGLPEPPVSLD